MSVKETSAEQKIMQTFDSNIDASHVWNVAASCTEFRGRRDIHRQKEQEEILGKEQPTKDESKKNIDIVASKTIKPATGRYIVDERRGYNSSGSPNFINSTGSFGLIVYVVDLDDTERMSTGERRRYIMRITDDADAFLKQWIMLQMSDYYVNSGISPYFLRMRTAFMCGNGQHTERFPTSLKGLWALRVMPEIETRFGRIDQFGRFINNSILPLYYVVVEAGNLLDLRRLVELWSSSKETDYLAHGTTLFKRTLMFQLAHGVFTMHRSGVTHRDLKTSNIVLGQQDGRDQDAVIVTLDKKTTVETMAFETSTMDDEGKRIPVQLPLISKSFVFALPVMHSIIGVKLKSYNAEKQKLLLGGIRAHIIDFDFIMVKRPKKTYPYFFKQHIQGTLSTMAPEVLFLSVANINRMDGQRYLLKPDIFSLGIVFGEILSGYSIQALLKLPDYSFRFRQDDDTEQEEENRVMFKIAYSGFPDVEIIHMYKDILQEFMKNTRDLSSLAAARSNLRLLEFIEDKSAKARRIVSARLREEGTEKVLFADEFKDRYGMDASFFIQGALFDYLDRLAKIGKVDRSFIKTLRAMLSWDFKIMRPPADRVLIINYFTSQFLTATPSSIWYSTSRRTTHIEGLLDDDDEVLSSLLVENVTPQYDPADDDPVAPKKPDKSTKPILLAPSATSKTTSRDTKSSSSSSSGSSSKESAATTTKDPSLESVFVTSSCTNTLDDDIFITRQGRNINSESPAFYIKSEDWIIDDSPFCNVHNSNNIFITMPTPTSTAMSKPEEEYSEIEDFLFQSNTKHNNNFSNATIYSHTEEERYVQKLFDTLSSYNNEEE